MDVSSISSLVPASGVASLSPQLNNDVPQTVRAAVSALNTVDGLNREFSVIRDPQTQRFVIVERDPSTGTVIEQLPPEDIVKLASQLGITLRNGSQSAAKGLG